MPELTSLKVPPAVRDRLAVAAAEYGITVRALLDQLSRRALDEALLVRSAREMSALRDTDQSAWSSYLEEGREWEQGSGDRVEA